MKYFACILITAFWLTACDKDDEKKEPTKTDLLSSQSWKYDNGGVDQDRNGTIDFTFASLSVLQPCILDNIGTFNANGTGVADEGATKCSTAAPQIIPFTWNFQNSETEINIQGPGLFGLGGKFTVKELSATAFSISKDTTVTLPGFPVPMNIALIVNLKH
jgi:hypothetical protein